jgi:hypothetical protein
MHNGFSTAKNSPTTNSKIRQKVLSFTTSMTTPPVGVGANAQRRVRWSYKVQVQGEERRTLPFVHQNNRKGLQGSESP